MIVNTNLSSLNAQRMLLENTKAASTAMERLATGSKINTAQDDVAGSAIADRMTSQVRGLNMALKNAEDARSMLSVAETMYLDQTDINFRVEFYPETVHGFVFPDRMEKYHRAAAERHWYRILSLYERNLKILTK